MLKNNNKFWKTATLIARGLIFSIMALLSAPVVITSATSNIPREFTNGLDLNPYMFKLTLAAGGVYKNSVSITNTNDKPVTLRVDVRPYTSGSSDSSDTYKGADFNTKTDQSEIVNWTSILDRENPEITIEAGKTNVLDFVIATPEDARSGSQNEIIFLEPTQPDENGNLHRVGITISANIMNHDEVIDAGIDKTQSTDFPALPTILGIAAAIAIPTTSIAVAFIIYRLKDDSKSSTNKKEGMDGR